ncbi:MAG: DoxX family protein [Nitrososphaerota archaeon]|nr:DoxX family protein [Nitrososphaerota archaeon]
MTAILQVPLAYVPYLALFLRVIVGGTLMIHGYPKVKSREQSMGWMKSMGMPGVTAALAGILEFFGGLFLVVGLIVPAVALLFAIQFASIIWMKKSKMKAEYVSTSKPSYEIDVLYLLLSIALIVLGAGAMSISGLVGF